MYIYIYIYIYILCILNIYIFILYICCLLKRVQFRMGAGGGASHFRMKLWYTGEEALIKKVFHLTHKENIKKTKEVLRKPGSCDFQFRYCETVCIKLLY